MPGGFPFQDQPPSFSLKTVLNSADITSGNLFPASGGGRYMMRPNRVKSENFKGVYIQKSALTQDDEAYYILYRDKNRRLFWEKVGWKNEGYTEEEAFNIRSARINEIRLSKGLPVQESELMGETVIRQKRTGISNGEGIRLRSFIAGIELCRTTVLKDLRVHELYLILLAIENNGISLKEFRKLLQLPPGAVSRNVRKLGFHMIQRPDGRWKDTGLEMLEVYRDPKCRRYKKVKLTKRGKQFAEKLKQVLAADEVLVKPMAPPEKG
jgi:DNA-binding MarR family transcriptional regulator